jgi:hypothetical protein
MLVISLALARSSSQGANHPSSAATAANPNVTNLVARWPKARFLAFSNSAVVPPIQVVTKTCIQVGDCRIMGLGPVGGSQKLVAMQLGVPVGLVNRVLGQFTQDSEFKPASLSQALRGATIEFRFLLAETTSYNPPAEAQQSKTDALQALLDGDLPKAWEAYFQRPWPRPPTRPSGVGIIVEGS